MPRGKDSSRYSAGVVEIFRLMLGRFSERGVVSDDSLFEAVVFGLNMVGMKRNEEL